MSYFCGVDIGGTFTDCVVLDERGNTTLAKVSSTPPDFYQGFIDALEAVATRLELSLEEFLPQTELLLHGTTVGTNVLVQMRGAKARPDHDPRARRRADHDALCRAFRGADDRQLLHVSRHRKPDPIIPRHRIKEVSERVDWAGDVVLGLNEDEARSAIQDLLDEGVEVIAISFLWGFVNPAHELRVKELVNEIAPGMMVSCAHELIGKPGEYERTAAAAINAFIGPATSRYIEAIDRLTHERGYRHPLLIMQAAGGVVRASDAAERPLFTIASGPVGGVTGAAVLGARLGHPNVIACDMGGTSFDVGVIIDGEPDWILGDGHQPVHVLHAATGHRVDRGRRRVAGVGRRPRWPAGRPRAPARSRSDRLRTGRHPADRHRLRCRARPLQPGHVPGRWPAAASARARGRPGEVGEQVGLSTLDTADGALRIVESHMADLMRQMTIERGRDPRDFVVYAFGGAGGGHAVEFARELGAAQVVVPLGDLASTWSALGVLSSDVLHIYEHSELLPEPFDLARSTRCSGALRTRARHSCATRDSAATRSRSPASRT